MTSLSTVVKTEHAEFIERFGRETACDSKREALMTIIDSFKKQYDQAKNEKA
ncbi:hypothetical protein [Martelella mediterranea]|uniref:hypothetical protein n=1 Tax=Martelella mediterranea TaxID=293089 RepID=UPI0014054CF0|nr:hypothetical protein [Martelella mediterranea]